MIKSVYFGIAYQKKWLTKPDRMAEACHSLPFRAFWLPLWNRLAAVLKGTFHTLFSKVSPTTTFYQKYKQLIETIFTRGRSRVN